MKEGRGGGRKSLTGEGRKEGEWGFPLSPLLPNELSVGERKQIAPRLGTKGALLLHGRRRWRL